VLGIITMDELLGAAQEVIEDLRVKWREMQEQEPLSHIVLGFIHAVDWTVGDFVDC
jgi:hypothetical protein